MSLRGKVRSCEICKANVESVLLIEKSQLHWFGHMSRMSQERLARHVLLATPVGQCPEEPPGGVTTSPFFLGPVLVWSSQNYLELLFTVRYSKSSWGCCPHDPSQMKIGHENE